jgi:hypothetical protein
VCSRVSGTPAASRPDYRSTQGLPLDRSRDHDEFGKNVADSKLTVVVERPWARLGGSWRCLVDLARRLHVDRGQDSNHAGIAHFLERRQACWMLFVSYHGRVEFEPEIEVEVEVEVEGAE